MHLSFSYDRKKVLQALRYHFISRPEIRILIILVNVFAIVAAVLFYMKKVRPEYFLLGSCLWLFMMASFWYLLPLTVYKRSQTFLDSFTIVFREEFVRLESTRGYVDWNWSSFSTYIESPNFIHLYFNTRSFFLVPKDNMSQEFTHELRALLRSKIGTK
ncbi:YcxB family protein [Filimonas effusa]|uniref:YcxB family protein n=1 Tax=Filimonas effusa TaxID=2508721 RepID=A0A4Q1D6H3_9BACT|nr:YcxB family protein [Filimonas effusa]RXK83257.1 YcxB family protein [Filimonas effusa]